MNGDERGEIRRECLAGRTALREPQIMQPDAVLQKAAVLTGWSVCRLKVNQGAALGRSPGDPGRSQGMVLHEQLAPLKVVVRSTPAGRPATLVLPA